MKLNKSILAIALVATALTATAQDDIKNTEFNPVTTGVTSLSSPPTRVAPRWVTWVPLPRPT